MIDIKKLSNIQVGGVDKNDHPDYCDAYIEYAEIGGVELTYDEYEWVNDNHSDIAQEMAFESLL